MTRLPAGPPGPAGQGPRIPALAVERTALAWNRTGLAFAANAALLGKAALQSADALLVVATVLAGSGAGVALVLARVRRRHLTAATAGRGAWTDHAMLRVIGALALATAVFGTVAALR